MQKVTDLRKNLSRILSEKGASAVEYALLSSVLVLAIIGGLIFLDEEARASFATLVQGDDPSELTENSAAPPAPTNGSALFVSNEISINFTDAVRSDTHSVTCIAQSDGSIIGQNISENPELGLVSPISVTGVDDTETYDCEIRAWNSTGGYGPPLSIDNIIIADSLSAPRLVTGLAGDGQATISWQEPAVTGNSGIVDYLISISPAAPGWPANQLQSVGSDLEETITGLENDVVYTFEVVALNASEQSLASSIQVTPLEDPEAPSLPDLFGVTNNNQADLSWVTPSNNGSPITNYLVAYKLSSDQTWSEFTSLDPTDLNHTFTLTNGLYDFQLVAVNAVGPSVAAIIPNNQLIDVPSPPENLNATTTNVSGEILVDWTAPANDGDSPITGYYVDISLNAAFTTIENTSYVQDLNTTIDGLSNGTQYFIRVRAENVVGSSLSSISTSVTPIGAPDAPSFTSSSGDETITVDWVIPSNNGSAITGYTVALFDDAQLTNLAIETNLDTSNLTHTFDNLTNGTTYWATISAINAAGNSEYAVGQAQTPFTVPDAPLNFIGLELFEEEGFEWAEPNNNGSAIIGYELEHGTLSDFSNSLLTSSIDFPSFFGADLLSYIRDAGDSNDLYYGRVRAINAAGAGEWSNVSVATAYTLPAAPSNFVLTPGIEQLTLSWTPPVDDGFLNLTGYNIRYATNPDFINPTIVSVGPELDNYTFSNLFREEYYFTIQSVNPGGPSNFPSAVSDLPWGVPDPIALDSAVAGFESVSLTWTPPADTGGIPLDSYTIIYGDLSAGPLTNSVSVPPTETSTIITGLTGETEYTFVITSTNQVGTAPPIDPFTTATPYTTPDAPTNLTLTQGDGELDAAWDINGDGGSPITNVQTQIATDDQFTTNVITTDDPTLGISQLFGNLTIGDTYYVRVRVENAGGFGEYSEVVSSVAVGLPDRPTNITVTHSDESEVTLSWDIPNDNASPITEYTIEICTVINCNDVNNDSIDTLTTTTNSIVLDLNTVYNSTWPAGGDVNHLWGYNINAVNAIGQSVQPAIEIANVWAEGWEAPSPPLSLSITDTQESADISWSVPTYTGADGLRVSGSALPSSASYNPALPTIQYYTLEYADNPSFTNSTVVNNITGTTYTVPSFSSNEIHVRVNASNLVADSEWSIGSAVITSLPNGAINWNLINPVNPAGQIEVTWLSANSGGLPTLSADIEMTNTTTSVTTVINDQTTSSNTLESQLFNNLDAGVQYDFRIRVENSLGFGPWSPVQSITPAWAPDGPVISVVPPTTTTTGEYTLSWIVPDDNGSPITGYNILQDNFPITPTIILESSGTQTVTITVADGAVIGSDHLVSVRAINAVGASNPSNTVIGEPWDYPDPPSFTVTPDATRITVNRTGLGSFNGTHPFSGGSDWRIIVREGSCSGSIIENAIHSQSSNTRIIDGLQNATSYCVQSFQRSHTPVNAFVVESDTPSEVSTFTIGDPPDITNITATSATGSVELDYVIDDNDAPVTLIQIQKTTNGTVTLTTTNLTDFTYPSLPKGETNNFRIRAWNSGGAGPWSSTVSATSLGVPDAPGLSVTRANRAAVVTLIPPTNTGGLPITGYDIKYRLDPADPWIYSHVNVGPNTLTRNISGLLDNEIHYIRVHARNAEGVSNQSIFKSVTPAALHANAGERFYPGDKIESGLDTSAAHYFYLEVLANGHIRLVDGSSTVHWQSATPHNNPSDPEYHWRLTSARRLRTEPTTPDIHATPALPAATCQLGDNTIVVSVDTNNPRFLIRSGTTTIWNSHHGAFC